MGNETSSVRDGARRAAAVLALVLAAGACGTDADFDNAARANTAAAWDEYLRAHPDGAHAREARERLTALLEDGEWQRARAADTADAYQRYLRGYPQGQHAHDALVAIANLNLAATPSAEPPAEPAAAPAPAGAPRAAGPPAPNAGAPPAGQRTPASAAAMPAAPQAAQRAAPAAAPPAAAQPPAGGYRVQLGAFADGTAAAERAWRGLAARHPQLATRKPEITASRAADGRTLTRLQVDGLDRSGAEALCAALAARHDPCLLVPPPGQPARPPR